MSFAAFALRTATVKALRGHTLADQHVMDSAFAPLAELAPGKELPFVVVYTTNRHEPINGMDLHIAATQGLVIEIGVAAQNSKGAWIRASTDSALTLMADAIDLQWRRALTTPGRPWADLWRSMVTQVAEIHTETGGNDDKGNRFAAMQSTLRLHLIREPTPGRQLGPVWTRFFDLAAADADIAPHVDLLRTLATGGSETWPAADAMQAALGMSDRRMRALFPAYPSLDPPP